MLTLARLLKFTLEHPLNRGSRLSALRRLLSWQVASRIIDRPIHLPFVDDTILVVERGMAGATGNWYCGLHEYSEMLFVLRVLRKDDLFVDVGANIGSYTVLASGAVGAKTICFEPVPSTYAKLMRNIEANGIAGKVTAIQAGISDREGILPFTTTHDTVNHVATGEELNDAVEVPVTTLDRALASGAPTLMKVDIEGQELSAIGGARSVLSNRSLLAVLMETNESGRRYGSGDDPIYREMEGFGFKPCSYDPVANVIVPASMRDTNTIFVRNFQQVTERLHSASSYRLCNGTV